jgi:hypothetical protein
MSVKSDFKNQKVSFSEDDNNVKKTLFHDSVLPSTLYCRVYNKHNIATIFTSSFFGSENMLTVEVRLHWQSPPEGRLVGW